MNIKKTLKNLGKALGLITAIGITSLIPIKKANTGLAGNISCIQSENNNSSQIKTKAFYDLPLRIKGFTYTNFYNKGGYFGETFLGRAIKYGIGPKTRIVHANEPFTQIGAGGKAVIPYLPKGISTNVEIIPLYFDSKGKVKDKITVGYSGSINLPKGFKLSSYGNWNIAAKGGPKWIFGEIDLSKKIGPINMGYNPALIENGDAVPSLEHRVAVGVDF